MISACHRRGCTPKLAREPGSVGRLDEIEFDDDSG
jgi:hypothetical protein